MGLGSAALAYIGGASFAVAYYAYNQELIQINQKELQVAQGNSNLQQEQSRLKNRDQLGRGLDMSLMFGIYDLDPNSNTYGFEVGQGRLLQELQTPATPILPIKALSETVLSNRFASTLMAAAQAGTPGNSALGKLVSMASMGDGKYVWDVLRENKNSPQGLKKLYELLKSPEFQAWFCEEQQLQGRGFVGQDQAIALKDESIASLTKQLEVATELEKAASGGETYKQKIEKLISDKLPKAPAPAVPAAPTDPAAPPEPTPMEKFKSALATIAGAPDSTDPAVVSAKAVVDTLLDAKMQEKLQELVNVRGVDIKNDSQKYNYLNQALNGTSVADLTAALEEANAGRKTLVAQSAARTGESILSNYMDKLDAFLKEKNYNFSPAAVEEFNKKNEPLCQESMTQGLAGLTAFSDTAALLAYQQEDAEMYGADERGYQLAGGPDGSAARAFEQVKTNRVKPPNDGTPDPLNKNQTLLESGRHTSYVPKIKTTVQSALAFLERGIRNGQNFLMTLTFRKNMLEASVKMAQQAHQKTQQLMGGGQQG